MTRKVQIFKLDAKLDHQLKTPNLMIVQGCQGRV